MKAIFHLIFNEYRALLTIGLSLVAFLNSSVNLFLTFSMYTIIYFVFITKTIIIYSNLILIKFLLNINDIIPILQKQTFSMKYFKFINMIREKLCSDMKWINWIWIWDLLQMEI